MHALWHIRLEVAARFLTRATVPTAWAAGNRQHVSLARVQVAACVSAHYCIILAGGNLKRLRQIFASET